MNSKGVKMDIYIVTYIFRTVTKENCSFHNVIMMAKDVEDARTKLYADKDFVDDPISIVATMKLTIEQLQNDIYKIN